MGQLLTRALYHSGGITDRAARGKIAFNVASEDYAGREWSSVVNTAVVEGRGCEEDIACVFVARVAERCSTRVERELGWKEQEKGGWAGRTKKAGTAAAAGPGRWVAAMVGGGLVGNDDSAFIAGQ